MYLQCNSPDGILYDAKDDPGTERRTRGAGARRKTRPNGADGIDAL